MASGRIHKAMVYLGLSDDDDYDEYEEYEEPAPAPTQPPRRAVADSMEPEAAALAGVRTLPRESAAREQVPQSRDHSSPGRDHSSTGREHSSTGRDYSSTSRDYTGPQAVVPRSSVVRPISGSPNARVHVVAPTQFGDVPQVGDRLKGGQPVIVNLQGVDRDLSRRIVDFCSGLTYALGGGMDKVADLVFLLTPTNVEVSAEEKRRLEERGYKS